MKVWCILETIGSGSQVVAVKRDEGAAKIAAKVRRGRWPKGDAWRVTISGPHEATSDYI